jgi:glycosyltransferase involved in cell wall biosynthesis
MQAYILSKNEEANIGRCLEALANTGLDVTVLDSGSEDRTVEIAREHDATVKAYDYVNHCQSYNEITSSLSADEWCLVLDADMVVSQQLAHQIREQIQTHDVVEAPVQMVWEGEPLRYASLYPPKPIAFRGGRKYFEPAGHGERLKLEVEPARTTAKLRHDDRKPYEAYLKNQLRYAEEFAQRAGDEHVGWKDWLKWNTPIGVVAVPFYCLFVKGGILDGRAALVYALDRMIVEAILYRRALLERTGEDSDTEALEATR